MFSFYNDAIVSETEILKSLNIFLSSAKPLDPWWKRSTLPNHQYSVVQYSLLENFQSESRDSDKQSE